MKFKGIDQLLATIEKGRVLSRSELEPIVEARWPSDQYYLRLMGLVHTLDKALRDEDRAMTIVTRHNGKTLAFLTDIEAKEYNEKSYHSYLRRSRRRNRHMLEINSSGFTAEEKRDYERAVCYQAATMAAIGKIRREFVREPYVRTVPAVAVATRRRVIER